MEPYYERIFLAFYLFRCEEPVVESALACACRKLIYNGVLIACIDICAACRYLSAADIAVSIILSYRIVEIELKILSACIDERCCAVHGEAMLKLYHYVSAGACSARLRYIHLIVYIDVCDGLVAVKCNSSVYRAVICSVNRERILVESEAVNLMACVYDKRRHVLAVLKYLCYEFEAGAVPSL